MIVNTFWGTKFNQEQTWTESGMRLPVTIIRTLPMTVSQIKTQDKDGYQAIQVSFGGKKREIKAEAVEEGEKDKVIGIGDVFKVGDGVKVAGTSRGRGFMGVVKRWGFKCGPKTHGQSDRWRAPGSIGQGTDPGRVYKGKKMAGRMGSERTTVKGLRIMKIEEEAGRIAVLGAIPGRYGSMVTITKGGCK